MENISVPVTCFEALPLTDVYYADLSDRVTDIVLLSSCVVVTIATCILFASELFSKHYIYRDSSKRTKTLVLLGLYPCTSVLALVSLLVPRSTVIVDLFATCYLSVCVFIFIKIIVHYYGGTDNMARTLAPDPISIRNPPLCCCCFCFPKVVVTRRFLKVVKITIGQVAVVRPLLLFIQAIMSTDRRPTARNSGPDSLQLVLFSIFTASSTLLAMYSLIVIVKASQKVLKKHRIRAKFLVLQLVLVFTNLQNVIFRIFYKFDLPPCRGTQASNVRGSVIHHMLLVIEMFLLAIGARLAYRKSDSHDISQETDAAHHVTFSPNYGTVDSYCIPSKMDTSDSVEASPAQLLPAGSNNDVASTAL